MTFQGAVVREQNVTFAIVIVKPHVLQSSSECADAITGFQPVFPGLPVILMAQDSRGVPSYRSVQENDHIVRFLANRLLEEIPWKEYSYG